MPSIEIKNLNLGMLADSDYLGAANSVSESIGIDCHSTPGLIKVNQKLTKESGTTIDEFCKVGLSCSNGEVYFFSSTSGKVWRRVSAGTYSLAYTIVPTSGGAGTLGAKEFNGYIYIATANYLHRITVSNALTATWATLDLNWKTFTNGDSSFHPMRAIYDTLYIGDKHFVATVDDAGTFIADALDILSPNRIKCLGQLDTDLLLGTYIADTVSTCSIIRWNTWSVDFTSADPVPEVGVNAFLEIDNGVMVQAGTKGNIYIYDGVKLDSYKTVKGDYGGAGKAVVNPEAVCNFNSLPLFGMSNSSGNPCLLGIYSLGSHNRNYPVVLNCEYLISQNVSANVEIGCIVGYGDLFLVSWKDTNSTAVYGVDKLDNANKYSGAYFITRVIALLRFKTKNYAKVYAGYRTLPANTAITLAKSVNNAAFVTITSTDNSLNNTREALEDIGNASTLKVKVSLTASANTAPELESISIEV